MYHVSNYPFKEEKTLQDQFLSDYKEAVTNKFPRAATEMIFNYSSRRNAEVMNSNSEDIEAQAYELNLGLPDIVHSVLTVYNPRHSEGITWPRTAELELSFHEEAKADVMEILEHLIDEGLSIGLALSPEKFLDEDEIEPEFRLYTYIVDIVAEKSTAWTAVQNVLLKLGEWLIRKGFLVDGTIGFALDGQTAIEHSNSLQHFPVGIDETEPPTLSSRSSAMTEAFAQEAHNILKRVASDSRKK